MSWDIDEDIRLACLVAVEHFDWKTGEKLFVSKHAYIQWVWGMAKRYNIVPKTLKEAVVFMKEAGAITVTGVSVESRLMKLQEPTHLEEAIAAYNERKEAKDEEV